MKKCIDCDKTENFRIKHDQHDIKHQNLKFFYVNINGLTNQKIKHLDLVEDFKNADIICFTETHLKKESVYPEIEKYKAFHAIVDRKNFIGRNIKGISIFCHEAISNTTIDEVVNEKGNIVILKLSNRNWTDIHDLFIIVCYKEDRESKFKTKNFFENVKRHMINLKMKHIILIGDLNGRIGTLNENKIRNLIARKSDDLLINGQGKEIVNFCNETYLIIANGRLEKGKCTYFTLPKEEVKKSVIDYLIFSENIMDYITDFQFPEPVLYTDHAPMTFNINIQMKKGEIHNSVRFKSYIKEKYRIYENVFKWTDANAKACDNQLLKNNCRLLLNKLNDSDRQPKTYTLNL